MLLLGLAARLSAAQAPDQGVEFFEKKIRPIISERCFKCHSAQAPKLKGGLRLDLAAGILKGGESGAAIKPGDPANSLLIKAIQYRDGEQLQMPPDGKLPDPVIADFIEWVKMGAPYPGAAASSKSGDASPPQAASAKPAINFEEARKFWSFQPPRDAPPPAVKNSSWVKSPIDAFILAKLEEQAIAPAPPADRRTLIRRATFDLTGLPPTPEEIDAFLADVSPGAFAKVVDRLLASPQYGERWGRHWLDVVRYTDSMDSRASVEGDITESYRYRDWVVAAFNGDMPYDQFVMNQIAGDLLPAAGSGGEGGFNADGVIATGMLAIGNWPAGDADKEKMVTDIVDDQIDVVTRGLMGLTVACARCHDHKFDPIPTADYYGLAGIFFSSHILPGPGKKTEGSPPLHIPLASKAELDRRAKREARMAELDTRLKNVMTERNRAAARAKLNETARYMMAAWDLKNAAGASKVNPGATSNESQKFDDRDLEKWFAYLGFDNHRLLTKITREVSGIAGLQAWQGDDGGLPAATINQNAVEAIYATIRQPAKSVTVHPAARAPVIVGWRSPIEGRVSVRGKVADADPNGGDGIAWDIELERHGASEKLASGNIENGGAQAFAPEAKETVAQDRLASVTVSKGEMLKLVISPKASHSFDTTIVEFVISEEGGQHRVWNLTNDLLPNPLEDGKGNPHADSLGNAGVWYLMDGAGGAESSLAALWRAEIGRAALAGDAHETNRALIESAALGIETKLKEIDARTAAPTPAPADPAKSSPIEKAYADLISDKGPFWNAISEKDLPPLTRSLVSKMGRELGDLRGNPPAPLMLAVGVEEGGIPDTPYIGFHDAKIHIRGRYDRLSDLVPRHLPQIVAGESQPAIAQGSGRLELARFVASADNPLTARVMVNRIWQHHFGEGIVRTPGNFGKLGLPPSHPELLDYLARRFVASGWSMKAMHRMIMLSSAYQQSSEASEATRRADPDNRFFSRMNRRRLEAESLRDSLLAAAGKLDLTIGGPPFTDLKIPRRTLYYRTVRSDRATFGALFDAADPTAITDKRNESTVAPQALYLMNNPLVIEQTQALAKKIVASDPPDAGGKIGRLYIFLYGRPATPKEVEIGLRALQAASAQSEGGAPGQIAATAWESYCQVLLCSNEFMFID